MNTMNLPGFAADASLYKTSGHYRTGQRPINLPAQHMGTLRLSAIDVPGEVIIIEDDAPWSPPSWGGHTGPGTSGGAGDTGGGEPGAGGDGGIPSKTPHKPPIVKRYSPKKGQPCWVEQTDTSGHITVLMNGKYSVNDEDRWICENPTKTNYCVQTYHGTVVQCYNGHSPE